MNCVFGQERLMHKMMLADGLNTAVTSRMDVCGCHRFIAYLVQLAHYQILPSTVESCASHLETDR